MSRLVFTCLILSCITYGFAYGAIRLHPLVSAVPNSALTASSEYRDGHWGPEKARLNNQARWGGCWHPSSVNKYQWIQVRFNSLSKIYAIKTRGRPYGARQWTTSYSISTSTDCRAFKHYWENGRLKVFPGNRDTNTIVTNMLANHVVALCLRVRILGYHGFNVLRFEVMGVPASRISSFIQLYSLMQKTQNQVQQTQQEVQQLEKTVKYRRYNPGRYVFLVEKGGRYQMTFATAKAACARLGAKLATKVNLLNAYNAGFSMCSCGWLAEGVAQYPIHWTLSGCGGKVGIQTCRWRSTWNAYCFKFGYKGDSVVRVTTT